MMNQLLAGRKRNSILYAAVFVVVMLGMLMTNFIVSEAYTEKTGYVSGTNVRSRTSPDPSTSANILKHNGNTIYLNTGDMVSITGEETGTDQYVWYQVRFDYSGTTYNGYIRSDLINVAYASDADFEQYLNDQGFPESYKEPLRQLHAKYPNWVFESVRVNLNWSDVISNESILGRNLVSISSNDASKSTATGAYDWATNNWYGFDTDNWVCASEAMVSYYMDPRNFLDETNIFQFARLKYESFQNASGVSRILAGTFMSGNYYDRDGVTKSYANTFVDAGFTSGVNPYHLASRCRQEQGVNGTSNSISGTYSGYTGLYNYFNIGAYPYDGRTSIVNGLIYARNQGWTTIYKSIIDGSNFVADKYVNRGQNTLYFQKFNVVYVPSLYTHQYMTNIQAASSEGRTLKQAYTDTSQAIVFRIPVYSNIPVEVSPLPSSGNPNNWLSSLNISGHTITPGFSGENTNYSLVVESSVASLTINASAVVSTTSIFGIGNTSLNYGSNQIDIICKAQNGNTRTYKINVYRTPEVLPPETSIDNPSEQESTTSETTISETTTAEIQPVYSSQHINGDYLTGITLGSSGNHLLGNFLTTNCEAKIYCADGSEKTGVIGTGDIVKITKNGFVIKEYPVIIYGDVSGDGKISNLDLVLVKKHVLAISNLSGPYVAAGDISRSGDNKVSNLDIVLLQKHILGLTGIIQ